jgi:hypothetical protein
MTAYVYRGDRMTDNALVGARCEAVRSADGRCIRGRNGNMLVRFGDRFVVVLARHLRKIRFNEPASAPQKEPLYDGGPGRTRTCNQTVMSDGFLGEPVDFPRKEKAVSNALPKGASFRSAFSGSSNPRAVRKSASVPGARP